MSEEPKWENLPGDPEIARLLQEAQRQYMALVTDAEVRGYAKGLEDAAKLVAEGPSRNGRDWVHGSFWDRLRRETAAAIRSLKPMDNP